MLDLQLLWSQSEGSLENWRSIIKSEIEIARLAMSRFGISAKIDILIQRISGAVIPEIGMVGQAYRRGLLGLTLDPDNPNFSTAVGNGYLHRHVAHEVHHCLRMAGPGYGSSLGEALVSEGLAGHFTRQLFKNSPEPWECAFDKSFIDENLPRRIELDAKDYDHSGWFFGSGDQRPRWFGYTLGYKIVGDWLDKNSNIEVENWINVPAKTILDVFNFPS